MPAWNEFENALDDALDFSLSSESPYGKAYQALKRITGSVERKLNEGLPDRPLKVEIEPGFQATMGQQLRVNVRVPEKQFRDTLFRAYIPTEGTPITLDLFGEQPDICHSELELQQIILGFLRRINERMASYRAFASP